MVHTPRSHEFARTACFYFNVGGATLHDLLEARRLLEPLLARLAATSGDQTTIERLMVAVDAGEEARGTDDVGRWRGHAIDFHGLVAVASGNPILGLFGQSLRDVFNERVAERVMGTEDRAAVGREHRAIAAAIAAGQPDVAERLMAAHMNRFIEIAVQVIEGLLGDVLDWR
jgi:DNA-binding FadR family transcriptional regulator